MRKLFLSIGLCSTVAMGAASCGGDGNPAGPSATVSQPAAAATTSGVRADVVLSGLVRNLNWRAHTFTLVGRTDASGSSQLIRLSERTSIMAGDRRVRPRTLENGASVEVHGVEADGAVIAARFVIVRRAVR